LRRARAKEEHDWPESEQAQANAEQDVTSVIPGGGNWSGASVACWCAELEPNTAVKLQLGSGVKLRWKKRGRDLPRESLAGVSLLRGA